RRQGRGDGFQIAHLADNNYVRILTENVGQGLLKARRIRVDLLLNDNAAKVVVNELDRVFNGDDLSATLAIDQIDHVVEGRRLPHPRGTGDQNKTVGEAGEVIDHGRQVEVIARANGRFAQSNCHLGTA